MALIKNTETLEELLYTIEELPYRNTGLLQNKTVIPSSQVQIIKCDKTNVITDEGYDGLNTVTVEAIPVTSIIINGNGTFTPDPGVYFNSVQVDIPYYDGGISTI